MEWSARNPDLNPTQHLWDNMEKRLRAMEGHPNHFSQLTRALLDIWENIGQNHSRNLILNMPERYRAVINARGDNTRFQENNLLLVMLPFRIFVFFFNIYVLFL
jgi:hypothetical protein